MQAPQETQVQSLDWEDPLEEEMAIHSSIFAWRIPGTEKFGGLQPMELQRVGHNGVTEHSTQGYLMIQVCGITHRPSTNIWGLPHSRLPPYYYCYKRANIPNVVHS